MKKKSRFLKGVKIVFNVVMGIFNGVLKTIFVDLFKNIALFMLFAFKPEERKKMKHKLEADKKTQIVEERLKIVERLVYSIYNEPQYVKKAEGKYDLKELKKSVSKK